MDPDGGREGEGDCQETSLFPVCTGNREVQSFPVLPSGDNAAVVN